MRQFIRGGLVSSDIDRHRNSALLQLLETFSHSLSAFIIEAHPVNKCLVRQQPEQPGTVIAGLAYRSYRAYLHKSEADRRESSYRFRILIQSCR